MSVSSIFAASSRRLPVALVSRNHEQTMNMFARASECDMSIVKQYAVQKGLYSADEIDAVEIEYKRYLALAFGHPQEVLPISKKLDDLWHSHILCSEHYTETCDRVGGYYLHHRPSLLDGGTLLGSSFKDITLELYRVSFGEPDARFWQNAGECCRPCSTDPNGIKLQ